MHIIVLTKDNFVILQKRSSTRVATSPGEITSSAGGGMDWKDFAHGSEKGIQDFSFREISEEISVDKKELIDVRVMAIIREFRRIGQPMIILNARIPYEHREIASRWEKTGRLSENPWVYPYWQLYTSITGKRGREYWEMDFPFFEPVQKIPDMLSNDLIQPPTKVGLMKIWEIFNQDIHN